MTSILRFVAPRILVATLAGCGAPRPTENPAPGGNGDAAAAAPARAESMEALLESIADGSRPAGDLEVVYDDMHGLHCGETITLRGDGTVTAVRRDPPDTPQTEHSATASPAQVLEVVELLLAIDVWEQEVPERTLVPDESLAHLYVRGAGLETALWEFYNDLEALNRLVRVRRALEALAF